VLDPVETLLFHSCHHLPVNDQSRRGIAMVGIYSQNDAHCGNPELDRLDDCLASQSSPKGMSSAAENFLRCNLNETPSTGLPAA
jgi:hypothetical protein